MSFSSIGAVIVLYQPNLEQLRFLLDSISQQVQFICLVDNSPEALPSDFLASYPVIYKHYAGNQGIAAAQNWGVLQLQASACEAVIKRISLANTFSPILVDYVISSGSLIPISVWQELSGVREELFIYWVDIEWGLRAKRKNYGHYILPTLSMSHSIGSKIGRFLWKRFSLHDDFRQYFIVRNPFLMFRYPELPLMMRVTTCVSVLIKYVPAYLLMSEHRIKTCNTLMRAIKDGCCGRGGNRH